VSRHSFVHALHFQRLTGLYDPLIRLTLREAKFKQRLLAQARLTAGGRILDLGCGTGTLAIWAKRQQPGADVSGLDGDPAVLDRARDKARAEGTAVDFTEAFSDRMPYADGSFDTVLSSLFFHHLTRETKERTVTEIVRVLRRGGELHVADWGPPDGLATRAAFFAVRLFDGMAPTSDNAAGALPGIFEAGGLADVHERARMRMAFGTLAFHSARRPA
jgi:ubiquinone/menaquinone biosynthesis C-methylase UbiE